MPPATHIPHGCPARHSCRPRFASRTNAGAAFMPPATRIPHGCVTGTSCRPRIASAPMPADPGCRPGCGIPRPRWWRGCRPATANGVTCRAMHPCGMGVAGGMNAAPTIRPRCRVPTTASASRPPLLFPVQGQFATRIAPAPSNKPVPLVAAGRVPCGTPEHWCGRRARGHRGPVSRRHRRQGSSVPRARARPSGVVTHSRTCQGGS